MYGLCYLAFHLYLAILGLEQKKKGSDNSVGNVFDVNGILLDCDEPFPLDSSHAEYFMSQ